MTCRRYTVFDPEPHGTRELVRYYVTDAPDTRQLYGRRMIRRLAAGCERCGSEDRRQGRLSRMRAGYRRKNH